VIRVLVAGEGANEIGPLPAAGFVEGERPSGGGVIEALMTKVRNTGWRIQAVMQWKDVPKLRVNVAGDAEARTVAVLALRAREMGCNALVFLRDRDGNTARERAIRDAIGAARSGSLRIAGGVPIEMLECWLLALAGDEKAHSEGDPVATLAARHAVPPKRVTAMVQHVRTSRLLAAPPDAVSLWRWLRALAFALSVKIPKQWPERAKL
jgi:hypothetical protein